MIRKLKVVVFCGLSCDGTKIYETGTKEFDIISADYFVLKSNKFSSTQFNLLSSRLFNEIKIFANLLEWNNIVKHAYECGYINKNNFKSDLNNINKMLKTVPKDILENIDFRAELI